MAKAPVETRVVFRGYGDVEAGILRWPMSVLRLRGAEPERLVDLAEDTFDPEKTDIAFASEAGSIAVCQNGRGLPFDEDLALKILKEEEVEINIDLHEGNASVTCWGCDLTYDYVKINGDYRT